jgi:hypothetical protein
MSNYIMAVVSRDRNEIFSGCGWAHSLPWPRTRLKQENRSTRPTAVRTSERRRASAVWLLFGRSLEPLS